MNCTYTNENEEALLGYYDRFYKNNKENISGKKCSVSEPLIIKYLNSNYVATYFGNSK